MSHTIKVRDASEVLSLIPFQLGFWPTDSLVAVSLRGPRNRVGLVARVDLTDLAGDDGAHVAEQLVSLMQADAAQSMVLVTFSKDSSQNVGVEPPAGFGTQLIEDLDSSAYSVRGVVEAACGVLPVQEAWHVSATHYSPWRITTTGGCSGHEIVFENCGNNPQTNTLTLCPEHTNLSVNLRNTVVSAHMVYEGRTLKGDRSQLAVIPPAELTLRHAADNARDHQNEAEAHITGDSERWQMRSRLLETWWSATAAKGTADAAPEVSDYSRCLAFGSCGHQPLRTQNQELLTCIQCLGILSVALCDTQLRDAALISITPSGIRAARRFLHCGWKGNADSLRERDKIARSALDCIVDPNKGVAPERDNLMNTVKVLEEIVATSEDRYHGAPRTLLALLAWWHGNAVLARRHLEQGADSTKDYSLARLINTALDHGLAPGWQRTNIRLGQYGGN